MSDLAELIKSLKKGPAIQILVPGTVVSVDKDRRLCEVEPYDEGPNFLEVRVAAIADGDSGLTVYPKAGSDVVIGLLGDNNAQATVVNVSEVESIEYIVDDVEFQVDSDGYRINKGDESLFQGVSDLGDQLELITVTTGTGLSGTPVNAPLIKAIILRILTILKP